MEIPIGDNVGPVPELIKHLVPNWDWLKGVTVKVAVAHGTANAKKIMEDIKAGVPVSEIQAKWQEELASFKKLRKMFLLY